MISRQQQQHPTAGGAGVGVVARPPPAITLQAQQLEPEKQQQEQPQPGHEAGRRRSGGSRCTRAAEPTKQQSRVLKAVLVLACCCSCLVLQMDPKFLRNQVRPDLSAFQTASQQRVAATAGAWSAVSTGAGLATAQQLQLRSQSLSPAGSGDRQQPTAGACGEGPAAATNIRQSHVKCFKQASDTVLWCVVVFLCCLQRHAKKHNVVAKKK